MLASDPPIVPRLRTAGSPMLPASAASAGSVFVIAGELATSKCRVIAPMVIVSAFALIPVQRGNGGEIDQRAGRREALLHCRRSDMPPAIGRVSEPLANSATVSGTDFGL